MRLPHPEPLSGASYSSAELMPGDERAVLLDQRKLPGDEVYVDIHTAAEMARAITDMIVRGAPAIGVAAAYGMALEARRLRAEGSVAFMRAMEQAAATLSAARPTAVNLAWATERLLGMARAESARSGVERAELLAGLARAIHRDDVAACRAMGALGARHVPDEATVLTHCNAGALATGGYGSALGVIRAAIEAGKRVRVLADETRPFLQGARLTAWELHRDGIPVEVITDGMPAHFFARGAIDLVVVGADRVARNGDVANKIGTYGLACLARLHARPFLVAAPTSTLDPRCADGAAIPIEERSSDEVVQIGGTRFAPEGVRARHPAFDVTPSRLVDRLITERGDVAGPDAATLMR